jgi:release factor glutamine methyltransferase
MKDIEYLKKYLEDSKLEEGIRRLNNGEPVQYIVGNVDFYGNTFIVNKNVLIPRFETEELVEKTIKYVKEYFDKKIDIVDLGTGSGCIAITLKKEINSNVDAVEISDTALEIAKLNAKNNNVDIKFIEGDMLNSLTKKYDLIISNPPYISYDEEIMDIVKNNEPHIALYAEDKGLYYYKEIIKNANKYLKDNGLLAFEIGYLQGNDLVEYAKLYFDNVKIEKDLSGKDRFLFIKNNS